MGENVGRLRLRWPQRVRDALLEEGDAHGAGIGRPGVAHDDGAGGRRLGMAGQQGVERIPARGPAVAVRIAEFLADEADLLQREIRAAVAGLEGQGDDGFGVAPVTLEPAPGEHQPLRRDDLLEFAGDDMHRAGGRMYFDPVFAADPRVDLAMGHGRRLGPVPALHQALLGEGGEDAFRRRLEMAVQDERSDRHGVSFPLSSLPCASSSASSRSKPFDQNSRISSIQACASVSRSRRSEQTLQRA